MAILALHSASTGLSALSTSLDVIANNLANVNTDGFKASRVNFADLLYQEKLQPGVENAAGDQRPVGLQIGLGTRIAGTQIDFEVGPAQITNRPMDLMIMGQGFFQVQVEDSLSPDGIAYTRHGALTLNSEGEIVLANSTGRRLEPPVQIPANVTGVQILEDGTVLGSINGQSAPTEIGTIQIASFVNPAGLSQLGDNLFAPTAASGDAQVGDPGEETRGTLQQGALEGSNVDPVTELVGLIRAQRAFELNSQSIKAADEVLQQVSQLRSF